VLASGKPLLMKSFSMDEISEHKSRDDTWIVIDGYVYDVSRWQFKHPGGSRVVEYFAGQDATVRHMFLQNAMFNVLRSLNFASQ
jgi:cytochrome b involved in lipid metabolism